MKKLSKELVKRLIREEMEAERPIARVYVDKDPKGPMTKKQIAALKNKVLDDEKIEIDPIDENSGPLTLEAIDRIIRQEVKSHFGA